jgi:3-phenylpropionate/trans-cinnamate dioxygenase ferredoxin reductase component
MNNPVVIVGAGLGALRTAESLRKAGYSAPLLVIGDEAHHPYNRPPLSKEALSAGIDSASLEFRRKSSVDDVVWRLDTKVVSSNLSENAIGLANGESIAMSGLVVASGIRPRKLPIPGPASGRFVLRTADDAVGLRERLQPGTRILIMGAGFIGCEVAATARALGCEVTIVALDAEPMIRPLGIELGAAMRRHHEAHGVQFHLGRTVETFLGEENVTAAQLDDGTVVETDLVLEAIGSVPNTEWLEGNGLDLSNGVLTDGYLRVVDAPLPAVAVGDVARHPNALFPGGTYRIEHWNMPTEMGKFAGNTLATLLRGAEPTGDTFRGLPSFWSDQYDLQLQSFGIPGAAEESRLIDGSYDHDCIVEYHNESGLVGVIGVNRTAELAPYRQQLLARGQ